MNRLIERTWTSVAKNFPDAALEQLVNGQVLLTATICGRPVKTWLPVMFPVAAPAYFWTPDDEVLAKCAIDDESNARNPSLQRAPNGGVMRWWMYKPSEWNPNRHTALTWLRQIEQVLAQVEEPRSNG